MNGFPVVRVELEGMRLTLQTAITEHIAKRDEDIRQAVNEAIANFDIKAAVREQVKHALQGMVRDAIERGARQALYESRTFREKIKEAVLNVLKEQA